MRYHFFSILIFVIYITLMTAIMLSQNINIAPIRYAFILLMGVLLVEKFRIFLLSWLPFIFILISYDFLREFSNILALQIHYTEMIYLDRLIFNTLPTSFLQNIFYTPGFLSWYDYLGTFIYFFHFILPVAFAFILCGINKKYFREFVSSFAILSYTAFITYVVFPAAGPWMAGQQNYISGVNKIINLVLNSIFNQNNLTNIYSNLNPDPIAVIPSLHAAFPFLIFLFCFRYFKFKALWFLPYVLFIWFFIVYSGEHYVVDIIVGILYAILAFLISTRFLHKVNWHPFFEKIPILRKLNV